MPSKLHARVVVICSTLLILAAATACMHAGAQTAENAPPPTAPLAPPDPGWPRTFEKAGNQVQLYQPQIDEWQEYVKMQLRMALAVTPTGAPEPVYGVLAVKANTQVDFETRTVYLTNFDLDVRFPDVPAAKAATLEGLVKELLPQKQFLEVSLDRVLAYMKAEKVKAAGVKLDLNPPPIFRSETPAIMVLFIGPPQFRPIKDTRLMFAVNTNWDVLMDLDTAQYYLLNGNAWLTAPDPLKGPWIAAKTLPPAFSTIPDDANWAEVRKNIPGQLATSAPKVFTSTTPAELIVTVGPPSFTPIVGTKLFYVSNPEMPLFLDAGDNSYYYLVAGRWFRAKSLDGPWAAASTDLPADFSKIPTDSPVSYVLTAVPETQEAKDAILLASIPHKATINLSEAKVDVTYDGPPKFEPIEDTTMKYAVNSPQQVIAANGQFYCCYQGVWFVAPAATGPWLVCTSVPAVIYTIPPTSPMYNVTYVTVYDSTPSTVTVGYTGGYSGEYVAATGVLMFGAGMVTGALLASNNSWYSCSPAFYSYGCAAAYHYGYGGYYNSSHYYGPYGGAGHTAAYNPATGTYSRGAYRYGPAGAASVHQAYNPYTGSYAAHAGATNGYQSWGRSTVSQGSNWAEAGHKSGPAGSAGWAETSSGKAAAGVQGPGGGTAVKTSSGDVYAGKDGNVYQKNSSGQWQSHSSSSGWQNVDRSSSAWGDRQSQLSQDSAARDWGNQRASESSRFGGGGFDRGGGGFGGGGFRGGGRR